MKKNRLKPSPSRRQVVTELDTLIVQLHQCVEQSKRRGRLGLVELTRALRRAQRLKRRLQRRPEQRVNWKRILDVVVWLAELTNKLYSLLFYMLSVVVHEEWRFGEAPPHCRWSFARGVGDAARYHARVLISS